MSESSLFGGLDRMRIAGAWQPMRQLGEDESSNAVDADLTELFDADDRVR
ncbi:hypothetical protein MKK88_15685 [Methylobacterium sp. E-005]|nr:hypothetical protein [Methylobacterium sp. E-005]MCJ2087413.1 hypothetical protein [Methylobacterium sp. E-005]